MKASGFLFVALSAIVLGSMVPRGAPLLRFPAFARGTLIMLGGVIFMYFVSTQKFEKRDLLLRRALLINPGGLLVVAGIGVLFLGHPESGGAAILAGLAVATCILVSGGMYVIHSARRKQGSASSEGGSAS